MVNLEKKVTETVNQIAQTSRGEAKIESKMAVREYFGHILNDGVTGKPQKKTLYEVERDLDELINSINTKRR